MNIILINKKKKMFKKYLLLYLLFISNVYYTTFCESNDSCNNALNVDFSLGYTVGLSKNFSQYSNEISNQHIGFSFKTLWNTEHLLNVGFETGYLTISSIDKEIISANLNAIPLILLFSMDKYNFELSGGIGYYYLLSQVKMNNVISESNEFDFGYLISLNYKYPLNKKLSIFSEVKIYNIAELSKSILSFMLGVSCPVVEW